MLPIMYYTPITNFRDYANPSDHPCYRLRVEQIIKRLNSEGHDVSVKFTNERLTQPCTLIITSIGEDEFLLASQNKDLGGVNIHDYTEAIYDIPILEQTKDRCDHFACSSSYIRDTLSQKYGKKAMLIKDPYEDITIKRKKDDDWPEVPVAAFLHGGDRSELAAILRPYCTAAGYKLVEICKGGDVEWNRLTWANELVNCQVALCPQNQWNFPAKSNVKVITAMALGLPVVASPLQSYLEIINTGENGFICYSLEDWAQSLIRLLDKPLRDKFYENNLNDIIAYSPDAVYRVWKTILLNERKTCNIQANDLFRN